MLRITVIARFLLFLPGQCNTFIVKITALICLCLAKVLTVNLPPKLCPFLKVGSLGGCTDDNAVQETAGGEGRRSYFENNGERAVRARTFCQKGGTIRDASALDHVAQAAVPQAVSSKCQLCQQKHCPKSRAAQRNNLLSTIQLVPSRF